MEISSKGGHKMHRVYDVVGVLLLLSAVGSCAMAKSAMQETTGLLLLVAAAILIVGSSLLTELRAIRKRLDEVPDEVPLRVENGVVVKG
jgi:FtsH-binding integral membrane protein